MSAPVAVASGPFAFTTMGTVVSLTGDLPEGVRDRIKDSFAELDERFSLYRPGSEADRIAARVLPMTRASEQMRSAYDLALSWREQTNGVFTPHRPDGVIDLNGVVKALAIQQAGRILDEAGSRHWCVNAGGDALTRTAPGRTPWVAGVVDPFDRTRLLTQVTATGDRPAVATSGIAERGEHIWRMVAGDTFCQVTVSGPDIVTADVLATAILAGGLDTLDRALRTWPIEVIAITHDGQVWATPVFRAA